MSEVSRMEDGFIVGITAPQQHPASWLGSEQHGDDWPGVSVGQGSVHLPHVVADAVSLQQDEVLVHGISVSLVSNVLSNVMIRRCRRMQLLRESVQSPWR